MYTQGHLSKNMSYCYVLLFFLIS